MSTPVHLRRELDVHSTDPVDRFMTESVLTVDTNDPAGEVLRIFAGYPVHHLPVLNQKQVVGMLSSADLTKLTMFLPKGGKSPIEYLNERMKVGQLIRGPVFTVKSHETVEIAAHLMAENGVHALPVVNAKNQLLGIISTTDIIAAALMTNEAGPAQAATSAPASAKAGTGAQPDVVDEELASLRERVVLLEEVRHIASRIVQAGQDFRLHSALRKALDAVNRSEQQSTAQEAQLQADGMLP
jgi:CBS-domain-containing membrane protein